MYAPPPLDEPRLLGIPVIRVAFALSIALHAMAVWEWFPRPHQLSFERSERDKASGPLVVEIAPEPPRRAVALPPSPPPAPAIEAPPARRVPAAKAPPRPAPRPPVIAQETPAPVAAPAPEIPAAATPAPAPIEGDFFAHLEARRRARGAAPDGGVPTPPAETERERHNRSVAANLGLDRTPSFGTERNGGGIFKIERLGFDSAEFYFYGWNADIRRNSRQRVEVRKGDNPDIRIAVVRRMIALIREREPEDFVWVSHRLGRHVNLSARQADNAGLEDFLMQEFFGS
jgi:outer membrane biosynthesis protein TonB